MIIVICEPTDLSGIWLVSQLNQRGKDVHVVLPEELIVNSRFSMHIGTDDCSANVVLADGTTIDSASVDLIINRMQQFPVPDLPAASDQDLVYAAEEARASIVAWFASIQSPVLSQPGPYAPAGDDGSENIWRCRAEALGIASEPFSLNGAVSSDNEKCAPENESIRVAKIGTRTFTAESTSVPINVAHATTLLADVYSPHFLSARYTKQLDNDYSFSGIDPLPDLSAFGSDCVDAIVDLVES